MNLKTLTNENLSKELKQSVAKEREATVRVLWLLRECERRMLYAERGYSSLFAYCISELCYSESAAQRRIASMRLLRDLPEEKRLEVETKLSNGDLNLSHLNHVQSHCRDQAKKSEQPKKSAQEQVQDKWDLLEKVANTSTRECEQILASLNLDKSFEKEKNKPINAEESRVSFVISNELLKKIERIQNVRGHQLKEKTVLEVLTLLVNEEIKRDEKKKTTPATSRKSMPAPVEKKVESEQRLDDRRYTPIKTQSRYISKAVYRELYQEADHQCQFRDAKTGKRCSSTYRLQIEHCQPFALGGSNELENLQLLCSAHNTLRAKRVFGFSAENQCST